jgi:hypothetical protein
VFLVCSMCTHASIYPHVWTVAYTLGCVHVIVALYIIRYMHGLTLLPATDLITREELIHLTVPLLGVHPPCRVNLFDIFGH